MLRHLRIENFKAWKDTGEIELAPISVFLGTNSSGKSSIFQFLMMLKQTMQDTDPATVLNTGDENSIVDMGQPAHMLYRHDTSQPLRFSYDWNENKSFLYSLDGKTHHFGDSVHFNCSIWMPEYYFQTTAVKCFSYKCSYNSHDMFSATMYKPEESGRYGSNYEMKLQELQQDSEPYSLQSSEKPFKFYGFSDDIITNSPNIPALRDLNNIHPQLFSSMFYLGPLRDRASRLYAWKGTNPSDVGIDGSRAIFAMLSARADIRKFELPNSETECDIDEAVAQLLKKMGLIERFRVGKIARERPEYEVQVQTKGIKDAKDSEGNAIWSDLPDVGCGVSQVLPVLVELFHAPPGSIILIEQPELHLHPSAQAALADVMIDAVQARENGKPRNIQLLIETHSEHFLRRLQRRVAEKVIDESMVRGYFADTTTDPFQLRKLEIDAYGNILNWPEDFFGDMAGDIFGQAEAAFRRKKDEYEQNAENH